ncbi:H-NS family nucleoid-associated regulatory protein [Sulfitobacter sp. 1A12057]|uniref:H-NS histone family protein n=1 Tax=Sulfitobacter sp. 1A12057 TaxID=3368567 RepID=UPI003746C2A0
MVDKAELKAMSRKELEKLLNEVKKALAAAKARDHREAKKAASKAAAEFGFSLGDIAEPTGPTPAKTKRKAKTPKKPSKPAFANPSDKSQTWTGKGRQPNWYRDQIAAGTTPDAMRISN